MYSALLLRGETKATDVFFLFFCVDCICVYGRMYAKILCVLIKDKKFYKPLPINQNKRLFNN